MPPRLIGFILLFSIVPSTTWAEEPSLGSSATFNQAIRLYTTSGIPDAGEQLRQLLPDMRSKADFIDHCRDSHNRQAGKALFQMAVTDPSKTITSQAARAAAARVYIDFVNAWNKAGGGEERQRLKQEAKHGMQMLFKGLELQTAQEKHGVIERVRVKALTAVSAVGKDDPIRVRVTRARLFLSATVSMAAVVGRESVYPHWLNGDYRRQLHYIDELRFAGSHVLLKKIIQSDSSTIVIEQALRAYCAYAATKVHFVVLQYSAPEGQSVNDFQRALEKVMGNLQRTIARADDRLKMLQSSQPGDRRPIGIGSEQRAFYSQLLASIQSATSSKTFNLPHGLAEFLFKPVFPDPRVEVRSSRNTPTKPGRRPPPGGNGNNNGGYLALPIPSAQSMNRVGRAARAAGAGLAGIGVEAGTTFLPAKLLSKIYPAIFSMDFEELNDYLSSGELFTELPHVFFFSLGAGFGSKSVDMILGEKLLTSQAKTPAALRGRRWLLGMGRSRAVPLSHLLLKHQAGFVAGTAAALAVPSVWNRGRLPRDLVPQVAIATATFSPIHFAVTGTSRSAVGAHSYRRAIKAGKSSRVAARYAGMVARGISTPTPMGAFLRILELSFSLYFSEAFVEPLLEPRALRAMAAVAMGQILSRIGRTLMREEPIDDTAYASQLTEFYLGLLAYVRHVSMSDLTEQLEELDDQSRDLYRDSPDTLLLAPGMYVLAAGADAKQFELEKMAIERQIAQLEASRQYDPMLVRFAAEISAIRPTLAEVALKTTTEVEAIKDDYLSQLTAEIFTATSMAMLSRAPMQDLRWLIAMSSKGEVSLLDRSDALDAKALIAAASQLGPYLRGVMMPEKNLPYLRQYYGVLAAAAVAMAYPYQQDEAVDIIPELDLTTSAFTLPFGLEHPLGHPEFLQEFSAWQEQRDQPEFNLANLSLPPLPIETQISEPELFVKTASLVEPAGQRPMALHESHGYEPSEEEGLLLSELLRMSQQRLIENLLADTNPHHQLERDRLLDKLILFDPQDPVVLELLAEQVGDNSEGIDYSSANIVSIVDLEARRERSLKVSAFIHHFKQLDRAANSLLLRDLGTFTVLHARMQEVTTFLLDYLGDTS